MSKRFSFCVFIFISSFTYSQTPLERSKVSSSYDSNVFFELKKDAISKYAFQKSLINEYKIRNFHVDSELKSLHRIEEDGLPIFYTIFNQGSSVTIKANKLYPSGSLGLNVTGLGMTTGVWDGDKVRNTHIEFPGGKVATVDEAIDFSTHATHVTGTIIANGTSITRRGIAYQAGARTYDFDNDYSEMLSFGNEGYLVSNHSYGYNASLLPIYKFGSYDTTSIEIDNASNAFPYYQIVVAAGNDRNDLTLDQVAGKGGYDLVSGMGTSKNGITVAAIEQVTNYLNPDSVIISNFSNYGPTDDGRIKPDISAKGVDVSSCSGTTNTGYTEISGTSMATPAITGMILLLQQHYNDLNSSEYMRASTVRGLICHSANEAGLYPGPDYEFGWGLANTELAATIISNKNVSSLLEENTLENGQIFEKQISILSSQKLSATICWTDPAGLSNGTSEDNRIPRLRNNLDLKILKDGVTYYPWKLEVEDPTAPATNVSDNDVDNVEKVEILNAQPGVYTIQVTHKGSLVGGSQIFSLIGNGSTSGLSTNTSDYEFDNSVFIYPNPVNDILNFDLKNNLQIDRLTINDISGKEVYSNNDISNIESILVSNLSSGVYFVNFSSGTKSVTKKFIKN